MLLLTGGSTISSSLLTGIDEVGVGATLFVLVLLLVGVVVVDATLLVSTVDDASVEERLVSLLLIALPVGNIILLVGLLPSL